VLKNIFLILLAALIFILGAIDLCALKSNQTGEQEIQVAVRVLRDGVAIDNLQKQDVELLIDGAPHAISGWRNMKKVIGPPATGSQRLFVLIFHLNEYPANMSPALDKLFHDLLQDNDRLLVLTNQATILIENLADRERSKADVEAFVKEQARRFQQTLDIERKNLLKLIDRITSDYGRITANIHPHYYMKAFKLSLDEYIALLREYKQRYLLPDPSLFSTLCTQLAGNPCEKWIIAFWQISDIPQFPRESKEIIARVVADFQESEMIDQNNYGNLFKRWLIDVEDVFFGKSTFPGPDIYNLFAGLETTFHAFLVSPVDAAAHKDADFKHVTEQCKEILTGLAKNSGGLFRTLTEPDNDMAAIAEKTDSYYILNFRPVSEYKKVRIQLPDKTAFTWFDPLPAGERKKECQAQNDSMEKQTELRDVTLQNRKLAFKIVHFLQDSTGKESNNKIFVRVFLKDGKGRKIFDQSRNFVPQKSEIVVRLDLPDVPVGRYSIEIEVGDWRTGKTQIHVLNRQLE
jgi:hypothetical protein